MATVKIQLNNALLAELGFEQLSEGQGRDLLNLIYDTLEVSVGHLLASDMSSAQLSEFEQRVQEGDDSAFSWLEANFPNYREMVHRTYDQIKHELSSVVNRRRSVSE